MSWLTSTYMGVGSDKEVHPLSLKRVFLDVTPYFPPYITIQ